jgi:ABC-type nitrate/sulfonate/bicarbonate transport system ATPase subunit
VLQDVSVRVAPGEFVSVIGPSGCGKSSLLTILTGLLRPLSGQVLVDGVDVTGHVGLTGYMPQKDLLLPWRSVLDNAAIGLEMRGMGRRDARREAMRWFGRFGLEGFERAYPSALSGGMRQRTALLRTFLAGRDILLLDEPLGALDAITRMDMQQWLLDVWESLGKTIVLVTHDVDEALFLSQRVYVMTPRPGRIAAEIAVDIPRPRDHHAVVTSPRFAELKRFVLQTLTETR